ncbi:hypothetical protein AOQ84DRAFT_252328, partial [Glonium stellatum]
IIAHPIQTVFHILSFLTLLSPGLVTIPLLEALEWTTLGPRAASSNSIAQSGVGSLQADSVLSALQSATMGEHGAAVVS